MYFRMVTIRARIMRCSQWQRVPRPRDLVEH